MRVAYNSTYKNIHHAGTCRARAILGSRNHFIYTGHRERNNKRRKKILRMITNQHARVYIFFNISHIENLITSLIKRKPTMCTTCALKQPKSSKVHNNKIKSNKVPNNN